MRGLTIFVSFIVLVCVVIISYSHSLALFEMGGFTGYFRHLGVIVVEATFVLGFLNIVIARFQGRSPGKPAVVGGIYGVLLVGWANIQAGLDYGLYGVLLGVAMPIGLVITESILAHALIRSRNTSEENTTSMVDESASEKSTSDNAATSGKKNTSEIFASDTSYITSNSENTSGIKNERGTSGDDDKATNTNETAIKIKSGATDSTEETTTSTSKKTGTSNEEYTSHNGSTTSTDPGDSATKGTRDSTTCKDTNTTTKQNTSKTKEEEETTSNKNTTSTSKKTGGHLRLVDPDLDQVKKVALVIYEKEGKLPGRPRLRKETGCRENVARRALAELKEQVV